MITKLGWPSNALSVTSTFTIATPYACLDQNTQYEFKGCNYKMKKEFLLRRLNLALLRLNVLDKHLDVNLSEDHWTYCRCKSPSAPSLLSDIHWIMFRCQRCHPYQDFYFTDPLDNLSIQHPKRRNPIYLLTSPSTEPVSSHRSFIQSSFGLCHGLERIDVMLHPPSALLSAFHSVQRSDYWVA